MSTAPRIILTRQEQRNKIWHQSLVKAGFQVWDLPLLRFAAKDIAPEFFTTAYDWILFTSPQAVDVFVASGMTTHTAKLGALGAGTSAALAAVGLPDDLGFAGLDGAELARFFCQQVETPATVLLPGAAKRMADPRITLEAAGFQVCELPTYETLATEPDTLEADFQSSDIIFFCSPSAVRAFTGAFAQRPSCVAIGETTAAISRDAGFPTQVAQSPDLNAMVRAAGCEPLTTSLEIES